MNDDLKREKPKRDPEEFAAPGWKNPYVIYLVLVTLLFAFLILMGYLALINGWIPNRGTTA